MSDLDTLIESVTTPEMEIAQRNAIMTKPEMPVNKSEKIRDYLETNPNASTGDIVSKLAKFGVRTADVNNVRAQLKRRAEKGGSPQGKGTKAKSASAKPDADKAKEAPGNVGTGGKLDAVIDHAIGIDVLEAGIEFVRKAGGVNEAQYMLTVIRRIKSL